MATIQGQLAEIDGIQSQSTRLSAYTSLLDQIYSQSPSSTPALLTQNLTSFIDAILAESVSLVITRPVLVDFVSRLDSIQDVQARKQVLTFALEKVHPRAVSFEEQAASIREKLADIYEEEGDHKAAARALQGITLESGQRTISADYKFSVYVRIMRNLLEEDEAIQAMQFLNRANLLIHETKNVEYILFFKLCQARILDATRRFLDAASKYHDLSFEQMVDESERMKCLSASITCAVLAPAGPARSRILATLYKDDRTAQNLPTDHAILEKMHFLRLLTTQEVNEFAKSLKPHQLALLPGDNNAQQVTVLSNAVLEHNLAAASRVYRNIAFDELGKLLGVDGMEAERYAATMIEQGRMKGWIDQPDGIIYFEEDFGGEGGMTGRVQRNWSQIIRWDEAIKELCAHVESVASELQVIRLQNGTVAT